MKNNQSIIILININKYQIYSMTTESLAQQQKNVIKPEQDQELVQAQTQAQAQAQEQEFKFVNDYPELADLYKFENKKLTPNKSKINFVVSHGGCTDGFMSATVVRRWLQEQGVDVNTVEFYNGYHGSDFSHLPEKMRDKYVVVCDFSFKKDIFNEMVETTNGNILMLDHHKTAQKELSDIDEQYVTFDMHHSGAFITWTYFYGFTNVPKAIQYVEDNDIWNKALPQTNEFTAFIFSKDFDFDQYNRFFDEKYLTETVFPNGRGMVIQNEIHVHNMCKKAVPYFMKIEKIVVEPKVEPKNKLMDKISASLFKNNDDNKKRKSDNDDLINTKKAKPEIVTRYYFAICVNSGGLGTLRSDIGNGLVNMFKNANLSVIYTHNLHNGTTNISYRSMNDRSDTTCVAALSGGGGHRNASACYVPYTVSNPPGQIIDTSRAYWLLDGLYVLTINEKKYIVLNSANMHNNMCQYLMQERYFSDERDKNNNRYKDNLPGYQEGMFCMRKRKNDDKLDEYYHGAVVWRYDGMQKKYKMTVKYLPEILEKIRSNIKDYNEKNLDLPDDVKIEMIEKKDNLFVFKFPDMYDCETILGLIY